MKFLAISRSCVSNGSCPSSRSNTAIAIVVSRPSIYGNPYTIAAAREAGYQGTNAELRRMCVAAFSDDWRAALRSSAIHPQQRPMPFGKPVYLGPLKGKNLACWCPLDQPCHADVLLNLANYACGGIVSTGPSNLPLLGETTTPHYWMHETSGVLRPAVEAFLAGSSMTDNQIGAMRAYLRQWMAGPWAGDGIAELRSRIDTITDRSSLSSWINAAAAIDIDPL